MTDASKGPVRGSDTSPGRLDSRVIHDGRVVHLSMDRVRFPDGSVGNLEFITHRGAAAVVPLKGKVGDADPTLVLVRQYRYAAGGLVFEIPAGLPEEGETWEACARRELEEEIGMRALRLEFLTRIFTTPGFTNEVIHLFLAEGLEPGSTNRDEDEFIEVVERPLSQVLGMIRRGEIVDGKSLAGVLFLNQFLRGADG